jgi:hypothetical protein
MPVRGTLSLTPTVKILDIKILNANGGVDDPNALYSQIEEIVNKYTQIYIYNLSI